MDLGVLHNNLFLYEDYTHYACNTISESRLIDKCMEVFTSYHPSIQLVNTCKSIIRSKLEFASSVCLPIVTIVNVLAKKVTMQNQRNAHRFYVSKDQEQLMLLNPETKIS